MTSSASSTESSSTESGGSSTGRPGSESGSSSSTTTTTTTATTGTTSPGTTLPPQTTGLGSSSTGEETLGDDTTGQPISCDGEDDILYLSFDGEELTHSDIDEDDAPQRAVANSLLEGNYGPYLPPDRIQLLNAVRGHFAPFGLCVTDQEPNAAAYDMLVITSDPFSVEDSFGYVSLDCGNVDNNNVNVLFLSPDVDPGPPKRPLLVSNFAGRFYGLESLDPETPSDIMNRLVSGTDNGATFSAPCIPVFQAVCVPTARCGAAQQSATARLNDAFR